MCNNSVKISEKEFKKIRLLLIDFLELKIKGGAGSFEWKDVVSFFEDVHPIKNWLKVRVGINWLEENNAIVREEDIRKEEYKILVG